MANLEAAKPYLLQADASNDSRAFLLQIKGTTSDG